MPLFCNLYIAISICLATPHRGELCGVQGTSGVVRHTSPRYPHPTPLYVYKLYRLLAGTGLTLTRPTLYTLEKKFNPNIKFLPWEIYVKNTQAVYVI